MALISFTTEMPVWITANSTYRLTNQDWFLLARPFNDSCLALGEALDRSIALSSGCTAGTIAGRRREHPEMEVRQAFLLTLSFRIRFATDTA